MADGLSITYAFVSSISKQSVEQANSYYFVKTRFRQFLKYLSYRGLEIAYFCVDSIMQDKKVDLINQRATEGVKSIENYIKAGFTAPCFCVNVYKL